MARRKKDDGAYFRLIGVNCQHVKEHSPFESENCSVFSNFGNSSLMSSI
jgi:hypothetical protein